MKKVLLITLILYSSQVFALCSLDENTVCTLQQNIQNPINPALRPSLGSNSMQNHTVIPMNVLEPGTQSNGSNQDINRDLNYNSNCQFGTCLDNPNNKLTPKQY